MVKAIMDYKNVCMKCLNKKDTLIKTEMYGRGYGSDFDNFNSTLCLCSDCYIPDLELWFDEEPEKKDYIQEYKYENNIHDFIKSLPLEGRELFENTMGSGCHGMYMEQQDWIDLELGILPDEKYEEYGMYSPSTVKAYEERFPTCENPVNITYSDNSKGCWCPFGASGSYGQTVGLNVSDECKDCEYYKKRETPIKEMSNNTYKKYEQYIKGKRYNHLFE